MSDLHQKHPDDLEEILDDQFKDADANFARPSIRVSEATEDTPTPGPSSLEVNDDVSEQKQPEPTPTRIKTRESCIGVPPIPDPLNLSALQNFQLQQIRTKLRGFSDLHKELLELATQITRLTLDELEGHEKMLEADWNEVVTIQKEFAVNLLPTQEYLAYEGYKRATTWRRDCSKLIYQLKGQLKKEEANASTSTKQANQLKRISLITFDGSHSKWSQFRDLFQSLVGKDDSIPPVQKLVRLKEALKGPASQLLSTFTITEENYEKAWDKLVRKYEDPRLAAQALFNRVLSLPKITKANAENLNSNAAATLETFDQLITTTKLPKDQILEQMLVHLLRRSLDTETLRAWELKVGDSKDFPSLKDFTNFVESCARGINAGERLHPKTQTQRPRPASPQGTRRVFTASTQSADHREATKPSNNCAYCKGSHFIANCDKFIALSPIQRNDFVSTTRLCFNCLGPHVFSKCKTQKTCFTCKRRHHTLIHGGSPHTSGEVQQNEPVASTSKAEIAPPKKESTDWNSRSTSPKTTLNTATISKAEETRNQKILNNQRSHLSKDTHQCVLLATAQARIQSPRGFTLSIRMLLDQGSELSFISEQLVKSLYLSIRSSSIELIGIAETNAGRTRGVASITLYALDGSEQVDLDAHVLKKLTVKLPSFSCKSPRIDPLQGLQLADPDYLKPGPIDIILGADTYGRILKQRVVSSSNTQLVGQQTVFGWILSGPVECKGCSPRISLSAVKESTNEQLLELLQRFWTQEELPTTQNSELSPDELQCEKIFTSTHSRDKTGRYTVRLPLRTSAEALGNSKLKASRQLQSVARRLKADDNYAKLYRDFIDEYETLGHMRRAPIEEEPSTAYYLPHHGVLREDALTTKLRVVFNGSSKTSSGISLNDILYPGGKLQADTMNVLTWLRKHKLVFGTDIVKMFRQINVHKDQWNLQRILWHNSQQQLITYELTTVTYGLNCSPWLSLRVLQQLAEDEGHRYPAAVETLTKGRYVDDIYGGAETAEELREIAWQLSGLCQAGGFPLQKWSSNCPQALETLGISSTQSIIQFQEPITKVLGLYWHQTTDTFQYKSKEFDSAVFTKRTTLSEIAQLFDPLGLIAPVVTRGKIIIQDLWKLKLNWDEPLPEDYQRQWKDFRLNLNTLNQISVPRWLRISSKTKRIQIHGFADASTAAMGAVVYLRTENFNEPTSTVLVCAKTRVAPIKRMTIPRLELNAAVLLTKLVVITKEMLDLREVETHLWTDSMVTLAWIKGHPSRWKDYVQNRVIKIQDSLPDASWRHISGKENPADCASRGIAPQELAVHPLWWTGPEWINQDPQEWPSSIEDVPAVAATEARPSPSYPVAMKINALAELLNRYSRMEKVLQVTATLNRAIERFRRQPVPQTPVLTIRELTEARIFWVKITQAQYFASVHRLLVRNAQVPRSHPLAKLTPTLDELGIIRLGGRLKNSQLDPEEIHPAILPRQSRLTTLVLEEAHRKTLHGGTQLTLAFTRQKYWIIGGRGTVRAHIQKCAICIRHRGRQAQQRMAPLPAVRTSPTRAFLHTGVDYAGPLPILKWRPTNAQPSMVHIAVFVCFSTSAVHLELVSRQTTDAFIGAYKRFTGRRGIPEVMYSDNATTFVGAASVLKTLYNQPSRENLEIQAALATQGTQWSFSPPRAPHFGGKWEAAVKSTKFHLKRVLGSSTFTYEELNSILIQIEACLNSRPITPMTDDAEDLQALTPGHFLIGEPLQIIPEPTLLNREPRKLQRWNLVTQKIQQFWSRWARECLQRYQAIYKWNQRERNIEVGDMVLMIDEDYPPAKWPLARVIEIHPGADGLTRVATIRTSKASVPTQQNGTPILERITSTSSIFKRPIAKLCLLPTDPPPAEQPPEEEPEQEEE
ncbi:uncharacterized protein LOC135163933 [Diachasmimorpha longicaudata]|uniref:uncharacterized protein LOC135163933 n=2 Tax=Diachasmimorpha longicaudata TaxID=58733 RepID=UPI0030B8D927